jgi:integrase
MVIVQDVPALMVKLAGSRLLHVPAMVSLFTGIRLSEVLALRWSRVDLDKKVIAVREALEQTKAQGIRFKTPKSKAGRRDITLPDILVDALREHRKGVLELRMQLGAGRLPDDALLFSTINGDRPRSPNAVSAAWANFAESIGMPDVTFHALRHTHASHLIDAGVDIVTISKRLGHAKPDITLRVYAHLFQKDDGKAAAAINAALAGSRKA